jgi:hypothetical protein
VKLGTVTIPAARRWLKLVEQFDSTKLELLAK